LAGVVHLQPRVLAATVSLDEPIHTERSIFMRLLAHWEFVTGSLSLGFCHWGLLIG